MACRHVSAAVEVSRAGVVDDKKHFAAQPFGGFVLERFNRRQRMAETLIPRNGESVQPAYNPGAQGSPRSPDSTSPTRVDSEKNLTGPADFLLLWRCGYNQVDVRIHQDRR